MKLMIISDIHGNIDNLNKVLDIYNHEHCSKLLILGDLFSYDFSFDREHIINRLNAMRDNIICVRGNCDININEIYFKMPYITKFEYNHKNFVLTHGHMYSKEYLTILNCDIVITGHTHCPLMEVKDDKIILNPGSISKSRSGPNSFIIMNDNNIELRDLENNIIEELTY